MSFAFFVRRFRRGFWYFSASSRGQAAVLRPTEAIGERERLERLIAMVIPLGDKIGKRLPLVGLRLRSPSTLEEAADVIPCYGEY
jgi:hypothetical protein